MKITAVKFTIRSTLFLLILYFLVNITLPYGNLVIFATAGDRKEQNLIEKFFINSHISRLAISIRGISCNSPIVTLPINFTKSEYISLDGGAISLIIQQYSLLDDETYKYQKKYALKLLERTIQECHSAPYMSNIPPLVDAIVFEQVEIVNLLLENGSDPNYEFKNSSGEVRSPLMYAKALAERENSRLEADPNHPKATGRAKIILDMMHASAE